MTGRGYRTESMREQDQADELVGELLRAARRRLGFSVTQVSLQSGYPEDELVGHEDGMLPLPVTRVRVLCGVLGIDLIELLAINSRPRS